MQNKDTTLSIRLSSEDRDRIIQGAREARLSQSDFILQALFGRPSDGLLGRLAALEARVAEIDGADGPAAPAAMADGGELAGLEPRGLGG